MRNCAYLNVCLKLQKELSKAENTFQMKSERQTLHSKAQENRKIKQKKELKIWINYTNTAISEAVTSPGKKIKI